MVPPPRTLFENVPPFSGHLDIPLSTFHPFCMFTLYGPDLSFDLKKKRGSWQEWPKRWQYHPAPLPVGNPDVALYVVLKQE